MLQERCVYNVFKCPKQTSCCELLGSFESEDEAEKCKTKNDKITDKELYVILIHQLKYKI